MPFARTFLSIAALTTASLATSVWAAAEDPQDSHHPAKTSAAQVAQATPAKPGMGMGMGAAMPGYTEQMTAMHDVHDKMLAAKTPEERNALMAEQMKLMQNGMTMMGGMGGKGTGEMTGGKPGDMAIRQGMLEQRMGMMQSMMQMMMDRAQSIPPTK